MTVFSIGIDLGTTYSSIGWLTAMKNMDKTEPIPSVVFFDPKSEKVLYGVAADKANDKGQCGDNYPLRDSKRFLAKHFKDIPQEDIKNYLFKLVEVNKFAKYKVMWNNKEFIVDPEDVTSHFLRLFTEDTRSSVSNKEDYYIRDVVIGVPASFSIIQRKETREAARKAGLNVLRLINEPTAAALAYIYDNMNRINFDGKILLVYDFGGGTFDVSIVKVTGKDIYVLATGGDDHLGGEDLTNNLIEYCKKETYKQLEMKGIRINEKVKNTILKRLRRECEIAKTSLSLLECYDVQFDIKDEEIVIPLAQITFNEINRNEFKRSIDVLYKVMNEADIKNIDYYILVGGCSLIPQVKKILHENFPKRELLYNISPLDAVVMGTTYYANDLINDLTNNSSNAYKVHDILNHSLGIQICKKENKFHFEKLLKKGQNLPAKGFCTISASEQECNYIFVYEGESDSVLKCHFLYYLKIYVPVEYTDRTVRVVFGVDENGLLIILAGNGGKVYKTEVVIS